MIISEDINMTQWVMGSGIVILLLVTLALGLRLFRYGSLPTAKTRRLKIVESMPLSAKHRMILVEDGKEEHVILLGPTQDLHLRHTPLKKKVSKK